jgi:hypothetical protein
MDVLDGGGGYVHQNADRQDQSTQRHDVDRLAIDVTRSPARTAKGLYAGLICLHVLHHANEKPIYGVWIIEEPSHHGYSLSPGTLYALLHGMESKAIFGQSPCGPRSECRGFRSPQRAPPGGPMPRKR